MPRACSWSVAITSPPASGCSRRTSVEPRVGRAQHGRQPLALERQRGAQPLARRARRRAGRRTSPSGSSRPAPPTPSAVRAREVDGADDAAVARARRRSRTRSRGRPRRRGRRRTGSRACRSGTACPTGRAGGGHRRTPSRIEAPQARSSPAWWSSSKTTNASRDSRAEDVGARGDLLVGGDDPVHVGAAARPRPATTAGRGAARTPPRPAPTAP